MLRPITLNVLIYVSQATSSATKRIDPTNVSLNASVVLLLVVPAALDQTTLKTKLTLELKYTPAGNGAAKTPKLDATTTATHMVLTWEWDSVTQTSLKKMSLLMMVTHTDTKLPSPLRDTPDTAVKVRTAVMKDLPTFLG